jgi:hypothetical protein
VGFAQEYHFLIDEIRDEPCIMNNEHESRHLRRAAGFPQLVPELVTLRMLGHHSK